jgi:pre-rRNA-processing protein TSR4
MWCYSIRAWRGLRYNEKYASKLERKLAKRREHQRAPSAPVETKSIHQNVNPFSVRCVPRWTVLRAD